MNRVRIYRRAQQLLPSAIQTSGLRRLALSPDPLQCLLPRRASHGAVALELADPAADAIGREGLAYFEGATTSRGALPCRGPAHYEAWRHSPLPRAWTDTDSASCPCAGTAHADARDGQRHRPAAAWQEGAYYTRDTRRGAWLVVVPDARLVVYRWWD